MPETAPHAAAPDPLGGAVTDLETEPDAFAAAFDRARGVPRLVLLLSPV